MHPSRAHLSPGHVVLVSQWFRCPNIAIAIPQKLPLCVLVEMESVLINRPSHRHRLQLRSFNPTMFTIFDTNHHRYRHHHHRRPADILSTAQQDMVPAQYRSCAKRGGSHGGRAGGAGGGAAVVDGHLPLTIDQPAKQYLSSKQQQQQALCWCKLCFDSRQNSINHESLFATPPPTSTASPLLVRLPLVNDREKARPIILAIDDNGNDTYVDSGCSSSSGGSGHRFEHASAGHCEACLRHGARKNVYSPSQSSERRFELLRSGGRETSTDTLLIQQQQYNGASGSSFSLLPSPGTRTAAVANVEINNQNGLQSGGDSATPCTGGGGRKKYNKRSPRFRRNHLKRRGTRPKVCPLELVGLVSKHVIEMIIPQELIGQEMELRLTWPATNTTPETIHRNSEIFFRIAGGDGSVAAKDLGDKAAAAAAGDEDEDEESVIGKRDRVEGGCSPRPRRLPATELKVMDCALQLFNSRNCNDFLYFTIQRELAASSGNRYNMSWHEFPRGATETQNSNSSSTPIDVPPPPSRLLKGSGGGVVHRQRRQVGGLRHQRVGGYFETAEKKLQVLCQGCRVRINPQLQPEFQRACLGCDKRFGVYRRDESFLDDQDLAFRTELRARQRQALIDLSTVLIQFNVHLRARTVFFGGMGSRVTEGNRFANLFNIDVLQSCGGGGSIPFHFHVRGVNRYVRFVCGARDVTKSAGDSVEAVYEMSFRLLASEESQCELVGLHVSKFVYTRGTCPPTIPGYLVSGINGGKSSRVNK